MNRDETRHEVLLSPVEEPLTSFDSLMERCHRALAAHLWMTCQWSEDGTNWSVGDFRYLVLSVAPDEDSSLYVQFWSEPRQEVLNEVASGARGPGAIRHIGIPQRKALEKLGFEPGGPAANYCKLLRIDSVLAAEAAALETLQIVYDVFGYRGQWTIEIERHRGKRSTQTVVHTSLTPKDVANVAASIGLAATVSDVNAAPVVLLTGRRTFIATLDGRIPGQNLYAIVTLHGPVTLKDAPTDEAIAQVNAVMRFVTVSRAEDGVVWVRRSIALDGGVSTEWLQYELQRWIEAWRVCERHMRRSRRRKGARMASPPRMVVQ